MIYLEPYESYFLAIAIVIGVFVLSFSIAFFMKFIQTIIDEKRK
jgi:vacuolar-type H+-ATPase subunit I/STV1